jgi:hypothetical protein
MQPAPFVEDFHELEDRPGRGGSRRENLAEDELLLRVARLHTQGQSGRSMKGCVNGAQELGVGGGTAEQDQGMRRCWRRDL